MQPCSRPDTLVPTKQAAKAPDAASCGQVACRRYQAQRSTATASQDDVKTAEPCSAAACQTICTSKASLCCPHEQDQHAACMAPAWDLLAGGKMHLPLRPAHWGDQDSLLPCVDSNLATIQCSHNNLVAPEGLMAQHAAHDMLLSTRQIHGWQLLTRGMMMNVGVEMAPTR